MSKPSIEGMKELEKTIKKLGELPQKCVTPAAKKGATVALKDARENAPFESGELKKGIIIDGERARKKGKKVYQVTMDSKKNDIFVKMSANGKERYYYPASQEYGFFTKNGGYIPGFHFLRDSIINNARKIEKTIVNVLAKKIDKLK